MAGFSGAVKLADLNDFIAPSQACVVSLGSGAGGALRVEPDDGGVALQPRPQGGWSQTLPTRSAADPVKISLQDCLACSGCVTSAETVLLEHQSLGEFEARLADRGCTVVVSLSGQSLASLAAAHGLAPAATARRLAAFLRRLGVAAVFDVAAGRDVALMEAAAEFVQRFRDTHAPQLAGDGQRPQPGAAAAPPDDASRQLPMLASACPGWVCYAEKTHGSYALPHISSAKSPQAVLGTLVKGPWGSARGLRPGAIYHAAVMPCYDKKLEAAREDFRTAEGGGGMPETDSVLTTLEVQQLLEQHGCRLAGLPEAPLDCLLGGQQAGLAGWPGGSGGYLEYIYRVAAQQLFGTAVPEGPLPLTQLRNADFQEVTLQVGGKPALRFALAYGFRNIQTLLRKIKAGTCPYHYVEVMACPSGCVNGGGQLRAAAGEAPQALIRRVEAAYHHPEVAARRPEDSAEARALYERWVGGPPASDAARRLLHTRYHRREQSVAASLKDW